MVKMQSKRLDYVDISKGLGMLAIIWGHINYGVSHTFVYSFHIPLFFFLSGLVFNNRKYTTFKEFVVRKFNTLVIPYLIFSFLTWLFWVLYNAVLHIEVESHLKPLLQTFLAQGSGGYLVHNVALWFISCLLLVQCIYYFLSRFRNSLVIIIISILFAVISYLMEKYSNVYDFTVLPWNVGSCFAAIVFYAVGNLSFQHRIIDQLRASCNRWQCLFWSILIVVVFVLICSSSINGNVSMGHEQYNNRILFYVNGFLGIFCVMLFSLLTENIPGVILVRWIKWIGVNSLYFMLIENPIKGVSVELLSKSIHISSDIISHNCYYSLIAFTIAVIVTVVVVKCILRTSKCIKTRWS